jgi:hypothetical protein
VPYIRRALDNYRRHDSELWVRQLRLAEGPALGTVGPRQHAQVRWRCVDRDQVPESQLLDQTRQSLAYRPGLHEPPHLPEAQLTGVTQQGALVGAAGLTAQLQLDGHATHVIAHECPVRHVPAAGDEATAAPPAHVAEHLSPQLAFGAPRGTWVALQQPVGQLDHRAPKRTTSTRIAWSREPS